MIGKARSINYGFNAISYALKKPDAKTIGLRFIIGDTPKDIASEMRIFQKINSRCKNNTISFVLSPNKADNLSDDQLTNIASLFLEKMKLLNNQSLVVKHIDNKKHIPHLHIYTNRINIEGRAYNDSFIGKKASRIADEVAQELNLTRAMVVQKEKELAKKPIKEQIQAIFKDVLSEIDNQQQFFQRLRDKGVKISDSIDKKGNIRGYKVAYKNEEFKASTIGNKYTYNKLDATIAKRIKKIIKPPRIITKPKNHYKRSNRSRRREQSQDEELEL